MKLAISVDGDSHQDSLSLYAWLREDSDLRAAAELSLDPPDRASEDMGTGEVISAVLQHAESLTSIVIAVAAWLRPRSTSTSVTFTYNGIPVTIDNPTEEKIKAVCAALERRDDAR
ncbi:hypothetical protein AB0M43_38705 [Longispora sp. NPDC051575]|uniref:effector-associated constant component EACC1 n=1 Tax=Longispora sp. NPDC051575 TaxID=3154943 RepID=UPI00342371E3